MNYKSSDNIPGVCYIITYFATTKTIVNRMSKNISDHTIKDGKNVSTVVAEKNNYLSTLLDLTEGRRRNSSNSKISTHKA